MGYSEVRFIDKNPDRNLFFATLRKNVDGYFKENQLSKHYNGEMVAKTVILLSAYILPFAALLIFTPSVGISMLLWTIMGFALAGIGMSIMHDANHGAYSSNRKVNYWLGHTLNLLGGSVFNWKMQHNVLHHTYTNIVNLDDDIDDKLILKFSPHTEVKWYHKLQFIYAFLFYGILTLYWVLAKDFVQYVRYTKGGVNKNTKEENKVTMFKIVVSKIVYLAAFIGLPIFVIGIPVGQVVLGFLLMHFIGGVVLTVIFQLAHTVEDTTHPLPNESGTIENNWAIHQMNTTVNFSRHSRLISWYVGGLNFQVEHHLFPTICHVHYPAIAPIVKATAEQFGVPYLENKTFMQALDSHITTLIRFGKTPSMNEAIV
ncbi:MAG: Linoleoyl-CoA desaturase [Bacteroidetes bacterium]|jgi:linoleoyl-CoA desaturase|nr:Linoleoyl-CoA desaturase [Bacteroidota bacterium]